jgi:hypothetical protein
MPGARYKKIHAGVHKVTYVEVKRKKGNFYKEVRVASSPIKIGQGSTTIPHAMTGVDQVREEINNPIPFPNPSTKVYMTLRRLPINDDLNVEPK